MPTQKGFFDEQINFRHVVLGDARFLKKNLRVFDDFGDIVIAEFHFTLTNLIGQFAEVCD